MKLLKTTINGLCLTFLFTNLLAQSADDTTNLLAVSEVLNSDFLNSNIYMHSSQPNNDSLQFLVKDDLNFESQTYFNNSINRGSHSSIYNQNVYF